MSKYALLGSGMASYAIAALWPETVSWQPHARNPVTATRPLLIHHSNFWFIQKLSLKHSAVKSLSLYEENIDFVKNWRSQDFGLEAFGWLVDPNETMSKLEDITHSRISSSIPSTHLIIATGTHIPEHISFGEIKGKPFETTQTKSNSTCSQDELVLHWGSNNLSASLPGLNSEERISITTEHLQLKCARHSYYRVTKDPHHLLMGDSLLLVPPTLASGFNSCLRIIKEAQAQKTNWEKLRKFSHQYAKQQFELSRSYHCLLSKPWLRGSMIASFKNKNIMHYLIQEILNGTH